MRRLTLALAVGWLAIPAALAGSTTGVAAMSHGVFHPISSKTSHAFEHSTNWSGFADTGGTYTQVKGSWKVPTVQAQTGNRFASDWVGIGGFSEGSLIQAGTSEMSQGGTASYNAWTEILPASEVVIPGFVIHPGDAMTVNITKGTGNAWTIVVTDATSSHTFTKHLNYASSLASAEWIHEAPTVGGGQSALALTSNVTFTGGTVNGSIVIGNGGTQNRIQMIASSFVPLATPSVLSTKKDAFTVADGSKAPKKPNG